MDALVRRAIALLQDMPRTGDRAALNEAVDLLRSGAATAASPGHPDRIAVLSLLNRVLHIRLELFGAQEDLDEAVTICRDAVAATPPDHPDPTALRSCLISTMSCTSGWSLLVPGRIWMRW